MTKPNQTNPSPTNPSQVPKNPASVVVVYHSGFGHTAAIAESIATGVDKSGAAKARVIAVEELHTESPSHADAWAALHAADALVLGSPTYMGTVSAPFKVFMDASGQAWMKQQWRDKLCAGFTVGGGLSGDKLGTLQAMMLFSGQHGMLWVSAGFDSTTADGINRLSSSSGLMAQADNSPASDTPPPEDHASARLFGDRIAKATQRWTQATNN